VVGHCLNNTTTPPPTPHSTNKRQQAQKLNRTRKQHILNKTQQDSAQHDPSEPWLRVLRAAAVWTAFSTTTLLLFVVVFVRLI